MKKTKIIIPAMGMLLLGTAASVTGTVAWFSANNSVTISGMTATTTVKGNLQIAAGSTNNSSDAVYSSSHLTQSVSGLLEPVSSVNAFNFYYTTSKVAGDGHTEETTLTAYNPADTSGFNTAYGTSGAVGYIDYTFYLKATSDIDSQNVVIDKVNLLYSGQSLQNTDKAWRTAVFAQQVNEGIQASDLAAGQLKTIIAPASAAYFSSQAVGTSGTFTTAPSLSGNAIVGQIAHKGETVRFYVVVRLFLEGNDTSCKNDTYAPLTDEYGLYLSCALGNTAVGANVISSQIAAQVTASGLVASVASQNGETIVSQQWQKLNEGSWVDISEETDTSYTGTAGLKVRCKVTTKTGVYLTNSVTLSNS